MTYQLDSAIGERTVAVNGVELHVLEAGDPDGPLVVLAHGFPELAFSWRHQLPALASAGYHVIAPDQRGYGRSSCPERLDDYGIIDLTSDLIGLLDDVEAEQATFIGHDWGSMVVWQLALLHPERVHGVCGMSVPFIARGPMAPTEMLRQVFGDAFFYMLYFQTPGVADADLGADPAKTLRRMLAGLTGGGQEGSQTAMAAMFAAGPAGFVERLPEPDGLPSWLSTDELDHYVAEFSRTGFTGGLNWYRNLDRNWELTAALDGANVRAPSLFVAGAADPVLTMTPPAMGESALTDHRGTILVPGAGHWVQQERPGEVNAALLSFLLEIHGGSD